MWSSSSINTQFFDHFKSRSTSQFIKDKLRDLQTLLSYLSGIVTSVFKGGIAGNADRGGWNSSKFTGGITDRAGPPSVFLLLLYSI